MDSSNHTMLLLQSIPLLTMMQRDDVGLLTCPCHVPAYANSRVKFEGTYLCGSREEDGEYASNCSTLQSIHSEYGDGASIVIEAASYVLDCMIFGEGCKHYSQGSRVTQKWGILFI